MTSRTIPVPPSGSVAYTGERPEDLRARVALEQARAQQHREQELLEQSSTRNSPQERIRIWERLHGVRLPRNATHRVLDVVAAGTGLTLEQVRDEQRRRLQPVPPADSGTAAVTGST